jgi:hypothetical protein
MSSHLLSGPSKIEGLDKVYVLFEAARNRPKCTKHEE